MILVEFEGLDLKAQYRKCTLGAPDFGGCVESINHLIDIGWTIIEVRLLVKEGSVRLCRSLFKSNLRKEPTDHLLKEILVLLQSN